MIDIHCHILPGVDDGPQLIKESLEMAKAAAKDGVHQIIATPHHKNSRYENKKSFIQSQVDNLNSLLIQTGIDMTILPGQETRIYGEIVEDYQKGEILTLANSQYLFIEFPSNHVPRYAEQLFFDLQVNGLVPIIVHPERNQEIIERPELLYQFVKNGALTQVTASSVCGYFGKQIKTFTHQLIESNLSHFVASDAHNVTNRATKMTEAYKEIKSKYGTDLEYMFKENAELLAKGNNVYKEVPERVKKKKFLGIF